MAVSDSSEGARPGVSLAALDRRGFQPGRSRLVQALWMFAEALVFLNPLVTSYSLKRWVLRRFGAQVGPGVIIKPGVHIKYPWSLSIGADSWIGERSWIDNLARVEIGANACISQGSYLCTGNHDWSDRRMGLIVKPIVVEDEAWVGAFVKVGPGVTVGRLAVITIGSVLVASASPDGVYSGNPAQRVGERRIKA